MAKEFSLNPILASKFGLMSTHFNLVSLEFRLSITTPKAWKNGGDVFKKTCTVCQKIWSHSIFTPNSAHFLSTHRVEIFKNFRVKIPGRKQFGGIKIALFRTSGKQQIPNGKHFPKIGYRKQNVPPLGVRFMSLRYIECTRFLWSCLAFPEYASHLQSPLSPSV